MKTNTTWSVTLTMSALWLGLLAGTGCGTRDWDAERRTDSESYRRNLQEDTRAILAAFPTGLALTDCVTIARERSTKLISSQIAEKIATLDRKAAFSAFLPQVQLSYETLALSKPPATEFAGTSVQLQDQNLHRGSVQILQPLFTPSEWLMYRSAKRGEEIATLVRERTDQMIELSVVNGFSQCCSLDEEVAAREQDVTAARQLLRQAEALRAADSATGGEVDRAHAVALESERGHANAQREAKLARSRLLQIMNLWPLADVRLKPESLLDAATHRLSVLTPGEAPRDLAARDLLTIPVETWMFQALLSRPEMHVQDRTIALRHNEVIRSLVMFLPNLMGFANYYTTSDSYTVNQEYWGTGLQASLSVFVGFRDVAAYRKARQQQERAYVEREETAMMVLLQVLEAYKNLQDAQQSFAVAEASATAAERAAAEVESQYRAGQVELSRLLTSQAAKSEALARRRAAAFAQAVTLYAFRNVLGGDSANGATPSQPRATP
jgi:outer membrane protein TolC